MAADLSAHERHIVQLCGDVLRAAVLHEDGVASQRLRELAGCNDPMAFVLCIATWVDTTLAHLHWVPSRTDPVPLVLRPEPDTIEARLIAGYQRAMEWIGEIFAARARRETRFTDLIISPVQADENFEWVYVLLQTCAATIRRGILTAPAPNAVLN